MRIELTPSAWKAEVLPLNYTRKYWSGRRDSNSRPSPWQGDALPLSHFRILVEGGGFEPPKAQLTDLQSAPFGHSGNPRNFFTCNSVNTYHSSFCWSWWREFAVAPHLPFCTSFFSQLEPLVTQKSTRLFRFTLEPFRVRFPSFYWSWWRESNPQPADYKSAALPLSHTSISSCFSIKMATWIGLEPTTSSVTGWHSNQLNYQAIL